MKFHNCCLLLPFLYPPFIEASFAKIWQQQQLEKAPAFGSGEVRKFGNMSMEVIERRQATSQLVTCGYYNGDPTKSRTADPGGNCRYDVANALWGFCPATVIAASDCGLAGNCVDSHSCSTGCGRTGTSTITTFTCGATDFCSTVLWTGDSPDVILSYIACGRTAVTEHLLANPTAPLSSSAAASSTAAPASTPSSSRPSSTSSSSSPSSTSQSSSQSSSGSSSQSSSSSTSLSPSSLNALSASGTNIDPDTQQSASSSTTTSASGSSPSSIGAIVGGIVGGLAVLCAFVLGVLALRRKRRNQTEEPRKRDTWWSNGPKTTEMQTAGLHEKEGTVPPKYQEMLGNVAWGKGDRFGPAELPS